MAVIGTRPASPEERTVAEMRGCELCGKEVYDVFLSDEDPRWPSTQLCEHHACKVGWLDVANAIWAKRAAEAK